VKYIANPVVVNAYRIESVQGPLDGGKWLVHYADSLPTVHDWLTPEMCARYVPVAGDYVIYQADGYKYINPKEVFERKYSPADEGAIDHDLKPGELPFYECGCNGCESRRYVLEEAPRRKGS
jgi:hypothetical protein